MRLNLAILSLVFCSAACSAVSWAQLAPSPNSPPVSNAPAPPPAEKSVATFKQTVNLVDLYFTVKQGRELVPHLNEQNCSVLDDEVPQTIRTFEAETNEPLTLGILLDTSGSETGWLPIEKDAASQFVRQVLRPRDEAFLLSFDVDLNLLQDYTNSPGMLMHALSKAEMNDAAGIAQGVPGLTPGGGVPTFGGARGTLFYDAIYLAANEKMSQETGRKAMIIMTDGDDQGSRKTSVDAIAAAEKNNIVVFVVWVGNDSSCLDHPRYSLAPEAPRLLSDTDPAQTCNEDAYWRTGCPNFHVARCMSENTGGRLVFVGRSTKNLQAAFQQIQDELRTQYVASFTPEGFSDEGRFHRIKVRCHGDRGENLKVQVRSGYYAPSAQK
jgi:VWFA-related protein